MGRPVDQVQRLFDLQVTSGAYKLRPEAFSRKELIDQMRLAWADVTDRADRQGADRDASYVFLYEGCVVAANVLIGAYGYRASGEAGHEQALKAAEGLLHATGDPEAVRLKDVRQVLRAKRHEAAYERTGAVSVQDLEHGREVAMDVVPALISAAARRLGLELIEIGLSEVDVAQARTTDRDPKV
jgi:hypothetical protein